MNETILDARGLVCPLPLLKMKQNLTKLNAGECLTVLTSDPGSVRDFQSYIKQACHTLVEFKEVDNYYLFLIKKAGP